MSVPIIIDEWIFHDLSGQNGTDKQIETLNFVNLLMLGKDKLVLLEDSPFQQKFFSFIKASENDPVLRGISRLFSVSLVDNSDKVLFIYKDEVKPIQKQFNFIPEDDRYIFQIYQKLVNKGCFILTTDKRWDYKKLQKMKVRVVIRDDFIKNYQIK